MGVSRGAIAVAAVMAALAGAGDAATLREALVRVYTGNPTLTGARAGLRATDEEVPIARSGGLPQANGSGQYNEFLKPNPGGFVLRRSATAGVDANVPIYRGGAVRNGVRAADARVDAGRAQLRSTESNVFVQAVSAYMDVIRDTAIVELNRGNVRVLRTNVQASSDRFQVGDLTRTDVAQSEARASLAEGQLQSALAQLDSSRETYLEVIGVAPDALQPPPPLPPLPPSAKAASEIAIGNNPSLIAARQNARAADYDVASARSTRLPTLSAFGQGNYTNFLNSLSGGGLGAVIGIPNTQTTATVGLQATVPLFQGGLPGARVRQAQARSSQSIEEIARVERSVIADARSTYSFYAAALAVIDSSNRAVAANTLAVEGVRAEQSVGTRNVLDVLDAEQELLNARVQLVTAQRDAYVAGFALLAAMGRAEARDLGLDGGTLYDPTVNYRRVRGSINDWANDPKPQPVAPTTAGVPSPTNVVLPPVPTGAAIQNSPPQSRVTRPQN
jgi:outer membrane protein